MMEKLVFDGKEAVFGRIATVIAKELLKGNSVDLINCESIIVSGKKEGFIEKIQAKRKMGQGASLKGPKYIRESDRLVKRMIRGMLPRDRTKGREAFKRLKCYIGKGELSDEEIKNAKEMKHKKPMRYFLIKDVIRGLK
jgi:large subunit ribosomal protein L13